jgi:hypothetical protein
MSYQVSIRPFDWMRYANTVNIVASAATQNIQLLPQPAVGHRSVRIVNSGTNLSWVQFGKDNTVTAAVATSIPLLPNSELYLYVHNDETWAAIISTGAGNTVYFTIGEGK